jgi:16S rRNA pseudouridine516 synthase
MEKLGRLDKLLAEMSIGTRSEIRAMVKKGRVSVNGEVLKDFSKKIDPSLDISIDGKSVVYEELSYYLLNKPAGVLSAAMDKKAVTVVDLIDDENKRSDLFPMGRLDKDTEGTLVITNDGELSHALLSPKKHIGKIYSVLVSGIVKDEELLKIKSGFKIDDDIVSLPANVRILKTYPYSDVSWCLIELFEGKFHEVKKIFAAIGHEVVHLRRYSFAGISGTGLKTGEFRRLSDEEISYLKSLNDEKTSGEKTSGEKTSGEKTSGEKASSVKKSGENASSENVNSEKTSSENASSEKLSNERASAEKENSIKIGAKAFSDLNIEDLGKSFSDTISYDDLLKGIKAVIFDFDGTLADSMWMWPSIDEEYLKKFGIECPETLHTELEGKSPNECAKYFQEKFNINESEEAMMDAWNDMAAYNYEHKVFLKPGVESFLKKLKENGIKIGIGSSNFKELVVSALKNNGVLEYIDSIHVSSEVHAGKPAPDIYELTAEDLGVKPRECLVFEDIVQGLLAGKRAGMKTVAVFDECSSEKQELNKEMCDYYIFDTTSIIY